MSKTRKARHTLPTIAELTSILRVERDDLRAYGDDGDYSTDVRLVVGWRDSSMFGRWTVNFGSSDYDSWHGHCGASTISGADTVVLLRAIARELLEQVRDSISQSEG